MNVYVNKKWNKLKFRNNNYIYYNNNIYNIILYFKTLILLVNKKNITNTVKIGEKIVSMIQFADDIIMIVKIEGDIQYNIYIIYEVLRTYDMRINNTTLKILVCEQDKSVSIFLNHRKLDQMNEVNY